MLIALLFLWCIVVTIILCLIIHRLLHVEIVVKKNQENRLWLMAREFDRQRLEDN